MNEPFCFRCVYFVPENMIHNDLEPEQGDDCIAGGCHRHCPVAMEPADDDHVVNYAYWPIVLPCDWCGEFKAKANTPVTEVAR